MVSQTLYTLLVGLVAVERLVELINSRRNTARQKERGGVEFGAEHYPAMVTLHTAFLIGCVAETWIAGRSFVGVLGYPALIVLVGAQVLRYWVIRELDGRWTTRVVVVPGDSRVVTGPFRFMTHPNYAAVVAEGIALPLIHTNWVTAVVFSGLNALLLRRRIEIEDRALEQMKA